MVKLSKKKRIEKAKVKLKAKKLPKGHNITDTSFKSKKIVIPSQLKGQIEGQIVTKKKLNVQELLSRLKHHNVRMRNEGISGLKELISVYEDDVIKLHFRRIIDVVSSLVLDIERDIRRAALKLLEMILTKVSPKQIEPHFKILRTYMSCAMTHINVSIREDSLLLLDTLLNSCPMLMVKKIDDILPTFLNMTSNMKNDASRTLSMCVNDRVTGVQWRIKVFERLTKYFSAIIAVKKHGDQGIQPMDIDSRIENRPKIVKWEENCTLFAAEFMSFKKEICTLPRVFAYAKSTESISESVSVDTTDQQNTLREQLRSLLPVLFEAWVEVAPDYDSAVVNILSDDAAIMLQYVIEILQCIWECLQSWEKESGVNNLTSWFRRHYQKTIMSAFLPGFPFSLQDNIFVFKRKSTPLLEQEKSLVRNMTSLHPKCTVQNLSLCYLFSCIDDGKSNAPIKAVKDYLKSCILEWDDMDLLPILEKVLRAFTVDANNSWSRAVVVEAAVQKCQDRSIPKELRRVLFSLLCDFIALPECHKLLRNRNFEKWVSELSCFLFEEEVHVKTLQAFSILACQNQKQFMNGLRKRSRTILNSLLQIPLNGFSSRLEGQKFLLNMLFHATDPPAFNSLFKRLNDSGKHKELASHAKNLKALSEFLNL